MSGNEALSNELQFRQLFEQHSAIMLLIDPQSRVIVDANNAAADYYGYSLTSLRGMSVGQINAKPESEMHSLRQSMLQQKSNQFIVDHRLANGDVRSVQVLSSTIMLNDRPFFFSVIHDVTERISAEKALQEQHQRLLEIEAEQRDLLRNLQTGIVVHTPDARIIYSNPAASQLLGLTEEQLSGKTSMDTDWRVVDEHGNQLRPEEFPVNRVIATHQPVRSFVLGVEQAGEIKTVWLLVTAFPEFDFNGNLKKVVANFHDITVRKEAEIAMQKSQALLRQSEGQLHTIFTTIHDLVWLKSPEGVYLSCNPAFERFFGANEADIVGKTDYDFVDKELADFFRENDRMAMAEDSPRVNEEWITFADDGHRALLETIKAPMRDSNGNLMGVLGIARDITERKNAEAALQLQKDYLKTIIDTEPECVKVVSADGELLEMNPAGLGMLEVDSLEEAKTVGLLNFVERSYRAAFIKLHKSVMEGNSGVLEFPIKGAKGTTRWLETHATALRDKQGHVTSLLGITRDITERKLFQQELERQAHSDYLTGLSNRGHFMQLAEFELARAIRYESQLSILMMDIDHFKHINDTHGHKAGDLVLKKLADVCKEALREVDIIGRVGGEEFAILLPETSLEEGAEVAERLRVAIENADVPMDRGLPLRFKVSIGITSLLSKNDNLDVLLDRADKALYEAKNTGRNKVQM